MAKRGQKPFEPTDEKRKTVRAMAAYGIPQADICKVVGCGERTLRKYFREELDSAETEANAKVAQALYKKAVEQENTAAQIFWLKTRAGWRETNRHEVTGADGGPVQHEDTSNMSDEERARRIKEILNAAEERAKEDADGT